MDIALLLTVLLALGIGAQWLAWALKQPSILFLLIIGIIVGPVLNYFQPDELLGDLLFPFISLGVAVILFEGSLTLNLHEIKQHGRVVQNLVTIGILSTVAVIAAGAYWLFDMNILVAVLFGALVCVTGPTVIQPLLRSVRPNKNISNVLKWEGIIIDPLGAIAVVLVYEYIVSGGNQGHSLLVFGKIVLLASILGFFGALILAFLIKRYWVPEYLRAVFTLAYVLLMFAVSNHLESESGLLTVTILGVILANWKGFPRDHLLEFHESITTLLISVLFIILAARINLTDLYGVGINGIILLLIVMFIARPLTVWLCSIGSNLKFNEKLMISWIGPRGIVAAAVSSLFAIRLKDTDLEGVHLLVPLVFLVIMGTVIIQGLGSKIIATLLKVRQPSNSGVLIVGANKVSLKVAQLIKEAGYEVLMADPNYSNIAKARMEGLRTYYGNPVSNHAELNMDLVGMGHLFAMSTDKELNTLAEMHFRHEFGERHIYRLSIGNEANVSDAQQRAKDLVSHRLFGKDVTFNKLASLLAKGAKLKTTSINKTYTYQDYREANKKAVPLFFIDKNNDLKPITDHTHLQEVEGGFKLISMVPDNKPSQPKNAPKADALDKSKAAFNKPASTVANTTKQTPSASPSHT
ncbi:cation:proton antiporter [Brackiella oedipodis]|uniref:cation:proton antiporter n=1 Tax=Brackiella oedipodis TaxID=124225 RepID=UPI000684B0FA|nr:sodium:proton antiporter [Brackiella oedipodis]